MRKLACTSYARCFTRAESKFDPLARQVAAHALEVTQLVSQAQSQERRKFIEQLKELMSRRLQTKKAWQQLVQQLIV